MSIGAGFRDESRLTRAMWLQGLSVWLLGLLLVVALVLVLRRTAGGMTTPLSPAILLLCGLVAAAISISIRTLHSTSAADSEPLKTFWRIAPTLAVVLIASSLSIPGTRAGGLFFLWMCTALGEIAGQMISQSRADAITARLSLAADPAQLLQTDTAPASFEAKAFSDQHQTEPDDPELWQRFTRCRSEQGHELLSGWLRVDFAPGERTKFAHVAFCPPLLRKPECEIELDDDQVTASVAQVLPQGARFEVKLRQAAVEPTSIPLQWVAYETVIDEDASQAVNAGGH